METQQITHNTYIPLICSDMDVYEIRKKNLKQILDDYVGGNKTELAKKSKVTRSQLQTFVSDAKTKRKMGSENARKIEKGLGLPEGWMDSVHENELGIDVDALYRAISGTLTVFFPDEDEFSSEEITRLIIRQYKALTKKS